MRLLFNCFYCKAVFTRLKKCKLRRFYWEDSERIIIQYNKGWWLPVTGNILSCFIQWGSEAPAQTPDTTELQKNIKRSYQRWESRKFSKKSSLLCLYLHIGYTPTWLTEWPCLSEEERYFCFHLFYTREMTWSLCLNPQWIITSTRYKMFSGNDGFIRSVSCVWGNSWYFGWS